MQKDQISMISRRLCKLKRDMEIFAEIYMRDPECWRGEAAEEEVNYIDADINEYYSIMNNMDACLKELK